MDINSINIDVEKALGLAVAARGEYEQANRLLTGINDTLCALENQGLKETQVYKDLREQAILLTRQVNVLAEKESAAQAEYRATKVVFERFGSF